MDKEFRKIQIKTSDGLVFYGDLIEMDSSKIVINNTTFTIDGKDSAVFNYIDKKNFSRQASFDRRKVLWFSHSI